MKGQHLVHGAGLAKRIEKILAIIAIIEPAPRSGCGNNAVHGCDDRVRAGAVVGHAVDQVLHIRRHIKRVGHQGDNRCEAAIQMVAQGGADLHLILCKNQCHRPFGQNGLAGLKEILQRAVNHRGCPHALLWLFHRAPSGLCG